MNYSKRIISFRAALAASNVRNSVKRAVHGLKMQLTPHHVQLDICFVMSLDYGNCIG